MDTTSTTSSTNSPISQPEKLSPSRASVYRNCPKQYHYQYVQGLSLRGPKKRHYDKGNYFHELCHVYYRLIRDARMTPGSPQIKAAMQQRIQQDIQKMGTDWLHVLSPVLKVFKRFIEHQSPIIDEGIVVLGVEEELNVPIELPSGRIVSLYGFIDLRYEKPRKGVRRIRDHKTGTSSWDETSVDFSNQLWWYDLAVFLLTGQVYQTEVSFSNTKEFKKKVPTLEETFKLIPSPLRTEKEMGVYLEQTCDFIDEMLDCKPTPHYDESVCRYCPYRAPCTVERMGEDSTPILRTLYVPRDETPRERTFTGQNSN